MALGGRPKEEGGHKPLKISVNKFISEALEKVPNKSKFLEELARPVLEKMDPGEASAFLWRIDIFISQGIIKATQERNYGQVQTLGWLANCLEDARKLCDVPPANFTLPEPEDNVEKKELEKLSIAERENLCNFAIIHGEMMLNDDDPRYLEKIDELEYKWRKKYGLI